MTGPGYGMCLKMMYGFGRAGGGEVTADQVRGMLERSLALYGNPDLRVGRAAEQGGGIVAEVGTRCDSRVDRFRVGPETGRRTRPN